MKKWRTGRWILIFAVVLAAVLWNRHRVPLTMDLHVSRTSTGFNPDQGAAVYLFLSVQCPVSNASLPALNEMAGRYGKLGFTFSGVIPGGGVSSAEVEDYRQRFAVSFPLLVDTTNQISQSLKATHTPQAVVRVAGKTVYSGRIDDRFADLGQKRGQVTRRDLAEALDAVVAGQPVIHPITAPIGCLIESTESQRNMREAKRLADSSSELKTFNRDVAPIIFEHCSRCHRPGEAAPFPLLTFEDLSLHADQVDEVLRRGLMPPWKPEPDFGQFANEHRLYDHEKQVLHQWIVSERLRGNPDDLPPTPVFPKGWQLGQPDIEVIMPEAFSVPSDGPDIYQHFVIPTGLTRNRLVNAFEFRPGAPEVVHHSIMYYDITGRGRELDAEDPLPGYSRVGSPGFPVTGSLGGWGPGGQPRRLPPMMGRPLDAGADMVVQIHYHPIGRPVTDRSRLGLYLAPESATHQVTQIMVANVDLEIPAGESRYYHRAEYRLPVETTLFDVTPHMHTLGQEVRVVANRPDGTTEPLIWIRNWNFYWQDSYVYADPLRLPQGTTIVLECWFDNTDSNPLNPSVPPVTVRWGDSSTDEMGICYFQATTDTWDDFVILNKDAIRYFDDLWKRAQENKAARSVTENDDAAVEKGFLAGQRHVQENILSPNDRQTLVPGPQD